MIDGLIPILIMNNNISRWNNFLIKSTEPSYIQNYDYQHNTTLNHRLVDTYIFSYGNEDIIGAHYSIKSFMHFIKIADISSGLVFTKIPNKSELSQLFNHFLNWANNKGASYVRVNLLLPCIINKNISPYSDLFHESLSSFQFRPIIKGRHTYYINLSADENDILMRMEKQTRYEIKRALRSNINIEIIDQYDKNIVNIFWELYRRLSIQKKFASLNRKEFFNKLEYFLQSNTAKLFITKCNNEIINMTLCNVFLKGHYLFGAMNPTFKNIEGCVSPGQITQWKMILCLKSMGIKIYDLGFCPGPIPIKEHKNYNIWRFKYNFGGDHIQFMPTYGKDLNRLNGIIIDKYLLKQ